MAGLDTDLALTVLGVALMAFGFYVHFGSWKEWYWKTRGGIYGYVPLGLMLVVESNYKRVIPDAPRYVSLAILLLLAAFAVYLKIKQPEWAKPKWVRWLDSQPKAVRQAMQKDALLDKNWSRHTNSVEAVELWVKELKKGNKTKS
ncbi:MAG TPA: hypothetical protein VLR89_02480 [Anaerolineaceae bacterium]|nr:hypothetical protein [Anaerolineaceae bacterium]